MFNSISAERQKHLSTALLVLIILLSIFVLARALNEFKRGDVLAYDGETLATISVSGEGEVVAVPDIGTFSFAVSETAQVVEDAQTAVTERTNEIMSFLEEQGIKESDIKTSYYNIYPRYEWRNVQCITEPCPDSRVLVGYEVSHGIEVTVRDLDETGALLSGVGSRGATNVSGLNFTFDDDSELQREARQKAISEAKEKARDLARDLDVRLVRIVDFNESRNGVTPIAYDMAKEERGGLSESALSVPTGENKIRSNVTIVYAIR